MERNSCVLSVTVKDWWAILEFLHSSSSIDMQIAEATTYPKPVMNRDALLLRLSEELPFDLDDYDIIPPKELIDNVIDDNFMKRIILNESFALLCDLTPDHRYHHFET